MEFKDIISISGMPGLYSLVSTKNNGIVVKSLEDDKTQFVSSRIHGVSSLDNISVYLEHEETTELKSVIREMQKKESEISIPDSKADPKLLQEYFKKIIPNYDQEKVHSSDMKKMIRWFQLLKQHDLIPAEETKEEEQNTEKMQSEKQSEETENADDADKEPRGTKK